MSLQFSYQFAILMSKLQRLLRWLHMVLLSQWLHASKVINVLMEMTQREWKLTAARMKTSLNSILSLHRENFGWIVPWMSRAPWWNKIRSPQSPLTAMPSTLSTAIYHCCPFPFFQCRCHCWCHCHGMFFSLFFFMHAAKRSLSPEDQCPHLQRPSRFKTGGLPLPPGSSATNNIRSAKQDDNYGASNIALPSPGS